MGDQNLQNQFHLLRDMVGHRHRHHLIHRHQQQYQQGPPRRHLQEMLLVMVKQMLLFLLEVCPRKPASATQKFNLSRLGRGLLHIGHKLRRAAAPALLELV